MAEMFNGCNALTLAPILPAKSIATSSYVYMFQDCYSLHYIKCFAENNLGDASNWMTNTDNSGTFVRSLNVDWSGYINSNWTVVNYYDEVQLDNAVKDSVKSTTVTTLWKGTQAEYEALSPDYDANTLYVITANS